MKASTILLIFLCGLTKALIRKHFYVNIPMTWNDAQSYCRKYYEDLSTVTSQEEQDMLIQLAEGNNLDKWIGLYRNESDINQFLWSDGNFFSYSSWYSGQPNNNNGNQYCVTLLYNWFDYECFHLYTFFCHKTFFILVKEKKTWGEALQYCRTHHSDLATITTERQLQLTKTETIESQTDSVWTGLRYLVGQWFWVNNKTLGIETSLSQCPAQPCRCGARNTKTDKWENRDCDEKLNFLCN
ncbi:macrophage mannose receptor 1-like protein [Labeo rohita]|uniref:Macrophage mannose receptor 1-like protein n=1 Tax=Labeo rohita TaxID=84645 RepID=A0A498MY03_LABRO|nr:macrophage mannose receptor 1-like protein [Labeo rohita]